MVGRGDQAALGDDADARDGWEAMSGTGVQSAGRRWRRNSTLPFCPVMGDGVDATWVNPTSAAAATISSHHARVHGRVADDALWRTRRARPRTAASPARRRRRRAARTGGTTGRIWRSEMNETSIDDDVDGARQVGQRQMARVEVLDHDDARIVAQRPVELPVADVERDDARGAALQQHVGEAAGGGADVERLAARRRRCRTCRARARASARRGRRTGWSGVASAMSAV